jgi:hypothetical protein
MTKNGMNNIGLMARWGLALLIPLNACHSRPFQTLIIYDSPSRFVRLEVDPTVRGGPGHSHPASVTTTEMASVLSGVIIEEPTRLMSFLNKRQEPPRHPAFTATEISFFAPLLAKGLGMATAEEIVTFYQSRQETALVRRVTSGGVFVKGEELHLILSNYRSPTQYSPDPGVANTLDGRLTPLRPIAPQDTRLDFEPIDAIAPSREGRLTGLLEREQREVVVWLKKLTSITSGASRESYSTP